MENCDEAQKKELEKYIAMPAADRDAKLAELNRKSVRATVKASVQVYPLVWPCQRGKGRLSLD